MFEDYKATVFHLPLPPALSHSVYRFQSISIYFYVLVIKYIKIKKEWNSISLRMHTQKLDFMIGHAARIYGGLFPFFSARALWLRSATLFPRRKIGSRDRSRNTRTHTPVLSYVAHSQEKSTDKGLSSKIRNSSSIPTELQSSIERFELPLSRATCMVCRLSSIQVQTPTHTHTYTNTGISYTRCVRKEDNMQPPLFLCDFLCFRSFSVFLELVVFSFYAESKPGFYIWSVRGTASGSTRAEDSWGRGIHTYPARYRYTRLIGWYRRRAERQKHLSKGLSRYFLVIVAYVLVKRDKRSEGWG